MSSSHLWSSAAFDTEGALHPPFSPCAQNCYFIVQGSLAAQVPLVGLCMEYFFLSFYFLRCQLFMPVSRDPLYTVHHFFVDTNHNLSIILLLSFKPHRCTMSSLHSLLLFCHTWLCCGIVCRSQGVIFALFALGWCISEVTPEEVEQQQVYEIPEQAYESPMDSLLPHYMSSIFFFFFSYCLANVF